jgi:hypothetical protein
VGFVLRPIGSLEESGSTLLQVPYFVEGENRIDRDGLEEKQPIGFVLGKYGPLVWFETKVTEGEVC